MTNDAAEAKARGVVEIWQVQGFKGSKEAIEVIAAALREHEHNSLCPGCIAFTSGFYEAIKKADSEGYKRGIEKAAKVADPKCPNESVCKVMHYTKLAEEIRALAGQGE